MKAFSKIRMFLWAVFFKTLKGKHQESASYGGLFDKNGSESLPSEVRGLAKGLLFPSVLSVEEREIPMNYLLECWTLGYKDGKNGQPEVPNSFFADLAMKVRYRILPDIHGKLEQNKSEYEAKYKEFEKEQDLLGKIQKYVDDIVNRRALDPGSFSWLLMIIYFTTSFLLLLADVPLSLMVTEEVFNVASYEGHNISNLFSYDHQYDELGCGSWYFHALNVLIMNWQILLMSLGIVLSAIFFKMVYDDLMLKPVDRVTLSFVNLLKLNDYAFNPEETENVLARMKLIKNIRLVVVFVLLVGVVITLVIFGGVRFDVEQEVVGGSFENKDSAANFFLAISVLFPLLSGVCFAAASQIWNRRKIYNYLHKKMNQWKKRIRENETTVFQLKYNMASLKKVIQNYEADDMEKLHKGIFEGAYWHGYHRGFYSKLEGEDEYSQAMQFFKRYMASKDLEQTPPSIGANGKNS